MDYNQYPIQGRGRRWGGGGVIPYSRLILQKPKVSDRLKEQWHDIYLTQSPLSCLQNTSWYIYSSMLSVQRFRDRIHGTRRGLGYMFLGLKNDH